jgi:hypothetical protein
MSVSVTVNGQADYIAERVDALGHGGGSAGDIEWNEFEVRRGQAQAHS